MKSKRLIIPLLIAMALVICVVGVVSLRFVYPTFRYNFDIVFKCDDTHLSYYPDESGDFTEYSLPLPPSTTVAYRQSDTSVVYYTKQSYDSFLTYYQENGYEVLNDTVYSSDDISFSITQINSDEDFKHNFIQIDAIGRTGIPSNAGIDGQNQGKTEKKVLTGTVVFPTYSSLSDLTTSSEYIVYLA